MIVEDSDYDRLPECIKSLHTEESYRWLPDDQKRTLIQRETEPECE
jgi:hypothetical protein